MLKPYLTLVVVLLCTCISESRETDSSGSNRQQPNIIFIFTDDQGYQDLGCYGHPYIKTPNLDKLAKEGTRFTQFYVNATVCSPSRASFMTGRYPARDGVHGHFADTARNRKRGMPNWLNENLITVGDIAKKAGYVTGHYGKWHLGHNGGAPSPAGYGFDEHRTFVSTGPGWDVNGNHSDRDDALADVSSVKTDFWSKTTDLFVDEAIDFLDRNRDKPFYLNLWTFLPHAPIKPSKEQLAEYDDLESIDSEIFESWMQDYVNNAENFESQLKTYMAGVTSVDNAIGRLLDKLDQLGITNNTLVFFSSDNGPEDIIGESKNAGMGSPGVFRGRKRSMYEGGIRMPCIVRWPGKTIEGHIDSTSVFSAIDWLPTVASILNQELTEDIDGINVEYAFKGKSIERSKPLFWEWKYGVVGNQKFLPPSLCVRDGHWKLFADPDGSNVELYHILKNPEERNNLADLHPDISDALLTKLLDWKIQLPD